ACPPPTCGRFPSPRCRSQSGGWTRRCRAIRSRRAGRWGWRKPGSRSLGAGDREGHLFSSVRLRRCASDRPGRGRAPHPGWRRAADSEAATPGARVLRVPPRTTARGAAAALGTDQAHTVAQGLRAEPHTLSREEVADAPPSRRPCGPDDATFIDTDATLLFDPEGDDVRAVLEFANIQLLEMRFLDQQ